MPRRLSRLARQVWGFGKALASPGAERTKGREHPRAAKTKPRPKIAGRGERFRCRDGFIHRHRVGIAIALAAALVRLHRLPEVFASSDAADLAWEVVKRVCGDSDLSEAISDFTLHRLGGVQPVVVYLHALLTSALGLSLDAPAWVATTIITSTLSVFFAYLLGRELAGTAGGLWAAALLAVSPIHVMLGRHLGAPWAYEVLFQLLIMYLLIKQVREPRSQYIAGLCVALAVYVWCGNQMMALFPVLAFGAVVGYWETREQRIVDYVRSRFATFWLALPVASLAWLLWVTFEYREGHLAHALFDKRKELGWHLHNWLSDLYRDIGHGPTWIGLLCVVLTLASGKRLLSLRGLPFVYFLCYSAPFWVWISRKTTLTTGYVLYSITGLLLLTSFASVKLLAPARLRHVLPAVSVGLLLLGTSSAVHRQIGINKYLGVRGFQGKYENATATTAAAAFIRNHSGDDTSRVFSDASGGTGLEPPIMRLYFRRPAYSLYDAPSPRVPYRKFSGRADKVDYLVVEPKNRQLVERYFGAPFQLAARITGTGRHNLDVYARSHEGPPKKISAAAGHRLYKEVYPRLCSR